MTWTPLNRIYTAGVQAPRANGDYNTVYVELFAWRMNDDKLEYMSIHGVVIPATRIVRFV